MGEHKPTNPSRRQFFRLAAAAAGALPFSGSSANAMTCVNPYTKEWYCCFLLGTRILAAAGEIPVEEIAIGDRVKTDRGEYSPVKWIGRRRFKNAVGATWPFLPIRIARHALDERTPHADLYVSPSHCLYIDGVLIPADHLVNDLSIVPALPEGVEDIEYFHLELETHEVIYAEGAAVETLLVTSDRDGFNNFVDYERLYGSENREPMAPYAPIARYNGGRSELKGLLRRLASPVVDIRDPIQVAYDRIAARAGEVVI
jgi:hypothetical protein